MEIIESYQSPVNRADILFQPSIRSATVEISIEATEETALHFGFGKAYYRQYSIYKKSKTYPI